MLRGILGIIFAVIVFIGSGNFSWNIFQNVLISRLRAPSAEESPVPLPPQKTSSPVPKQTREAVQQKPVIAKKESRSADTTVPPVATNGSLVTKETISESAIIAPGPLVAPIQTTPPPSSWSLSVKGVIEYTNGARSLNGGLPALIENQTLNRDAEIKLSDMFTRQYFEHISPTGVGPAEIALSVGYAYVIVGENLALGDFGSDEKLVTAWMNSPGHRANILNNHYQEIGVAVGKGIYEGRETWLAVQSFGMPLSACPAINAQIKIQIENNNAQIVMERTQIDTKKAQIDSTATSDLNYNIYVGEFNSLLFPYNALIESTRALIADYNEGVQAYNNCVTLASAH